MLAVNYALQISCKRWKLKNFMVLSEDFSEKYFYSLTIVLVLIIISFCLILTSSAAAGIREVL